MTDLPSHVQALLDERALCAVPVAARELLDRAVEDRVALDRCRRLLRSIAHEQGDGSMARELEVAHTRIRELEEIVERQNTKLNRRKPA